VAAGLTEKGVTPIDGRRLRDGARFFFHLLWMLLLSGVAAQAQGLDQISALAQAGAPQLALALLDRNEPKPTQDADGWMAWERERIAILEARSDWQGIVAHLSHIPAALPAAFQQWASTHRADALLKLDRPVAAREALRRLIWGTPGAPKKTLAAWRRLVIRSYLAEGRADDAYAAMLRYRQDYGADPQAVELIAQVMLTEGHPGDAVPLLGGVKDVRGRALRLLAALRSAASPPRAVREQSRKLLKATGETVQTRELVIAVVAEAAHRSGDYSGEVEALERLLIHTRKQPLPKGLFTLSPDSLWDAYIDYARKVGNREQLLEGNDAAWFAGAKAAGRRFPVRVRSFYALLALKGQSAKDRARATRALLKRLLALDDGTELVRRLYLDSRRFASIQAVPTGVSQALIEPALTAGDIHLASRLMQGLSSPPPGTDPVMWQLGRARVFIMAGHIPKGIAVLRPLVDGAGKLDSEHVDRLVQVLFDLQTVGDNDAAYDLFNRLLLHVRSQKRQRELLYWMGDSRSAQHRPVAAAELYLRSAILPGPDTMDPWAQTARYQAAKSLAKAGLVDDARTLYQQLLKATDDPARRAVLQRGLQQLWLQARKARGNGGQAHE